MASGDDETLKAYIDESLEHLSGIETDLLEIEKGGAQIDAELVNKVFRAAHSIKGGAGFIGLSHIKTLSHQMENVLGLMRNRKLIPNAENINFLLLASDALKDLLVHVEDSDEMDISEHVEALSAITEPPAETPPSSPALEALEESLPLVFPDGRNALTITSDHLAQIRNIRSEGRSVYLIEVSVLKPSSNEPEDPHIILDEVRGYGTVLANDVLEDSKPPTLVLLFDCILEPEDLVSLFDTALLQIHEVAEDGQLADAAIPPNEEEKTSQAAAAVSVEKSERAPFVEIPDSAEPVTAPPAEQTSFAEAAPHTPEDSCERPSLIPETSLRVHVGLLDSLMTLAGELVLGRNQLLQSLSRKDLNASEVVGKRIDHITSELQEAIMRTRMQPIGNVFKKFPRVARDMARNLGKEVELLIQGKDVELDKTLIEAIADPLTHLVRNAIDHGIELPAERDKTGKHPIGRIRLNAFHEAGQVNIEIRDDGRGLNADKLAQAAVLKGFVTQEQASALTENEKIRLIFLPGFSTAEEVTDLSGRGVGMDVVKTNLDRLGGQIDLETQPGKGTTVRVKVPLTLAIIPCQIIFTEGERYAIPQVNLVELIRIPAGQASKRIEVVGEAEVLRLRSRLLPLVKLADLLGLERTYTDPNSRRNRIDRRTRIADRRSRKSPLFGSLGNSDLNMADTDVKSTSREKIHQTHGPRTDRRYRAASGFNIAVVTSGGLKYGLVVDALFDSEEIVVHPLGRHLKRTRGYAGATIMGDGKVALILDVAELAELAELSSVHESARAKELAIEKEKARQTVKDRQFLLLFRSALNQQFAVPLNQVLRIEKISAADVEEIGGRKVVQYRGGNLLLFTIDQVAQVNPLADKAHLLVLVFNLAGREIGLLATGPVDAVPAAEKMDEKALKQPGIMASLIIDGQTTLMVDMYEIVSTLNPQWFTRPQDSERGPDDSQKILIVEDSNFFRNQVKGFIEADGYKVIEARDGLEGWQLLNQQGHDVSLVVTDIEMPNLDGYGLAERIKSDERYAHLPVIALTTLAEDEDIARGREVGIDDYQIKLDREKLIKSINRFTGGRT